MNAPHAPQQQRPNGPPAQPAPFRFNISRGSVAGPPRIVIHGAPGIGKSTLASCAPNPLFLDLEHGTLQLNVARVDNIDTWEALITTVRALVTEPHDFKTIVIDTLDRAEWLAHQYVCKVSNKKSIEEFAYGKGLVATYEQFRLLTAALEAARIRRDMAIIVIAHSKIERKPSESVGGDDYDQWDLKVHKHVAGIFREMFDAILFARLEVFTQKKENGRVRGFGDARVLETQLSPAWVAKNRYAMPRQIPLTWEDLSAAMDRGADAVMESLRAEASAALEKLAGLDAEAADKARAAVDGASTATALSAVLGRINAGIAARVNDATGTGTATASTNAPAAAQG